MEFSRHEYWSGCHFLLQGIFPTQGSNSGLLHCRQTLYHLSHQGSLELLKSKGKGTNNLVVTTKFHFFLYQLPGGLFKETGVLG